MGRSNRMQLVRSAGRTEPRKIAAEPRGLAGWLIAVFQRWRGLREAQGKQMQLVETLPLGGKRQLMLVSCAGEKFLVGGGSESVEAIVRLNAEPMPIVDAPGLDETCR